MFRAFAELLTFASLPIWLFTLTYTFVWRAWTFLPSFVTASVLVAPLLGLAIVCEHRDAAASGRLPRSFFPSRRGFANFLFVTCLLLVGGVYTFAFFATAINLRDGDAWSDAWARLAFLGAAIVLAWQLQFWTTSIAHRWFAGLVYDDWLESLGAPITWTHLRRFFLNEISALLLVILAVLGAAVVWFGIDWLSPLLDFEVGGGKRARKFQATVRWLIRHPNSVTLFAATLVVASTGVLLCKAAAERYRRNTKEESHERTTDL